MKKRRRSNEAATLLLRYDELVFRPYSEDAVDSILRSCVSANGRRPRIRRSQPLLLDTADTALAAARGMSLPKRTISTENAPLIITDRGEPTAALSAVAYRPPSPYVVPSVIRHLPLVPDAMEAWRQRDAR